MSIEKIKIQIEKLTPEEKQKLLTDVIAKFRQEVFTNPS